MITTEISHKFQMFIFGYFATMPWEFITLHSSSSTKGTAKMADFGLSCVRGSKESNLWNLQLFFVAWKLLGAMFVSCQEGRIPPNCFFV